MCMALYRNYNPVRRQLSKKKDQIDQFQLKGFPGGDPQQVYELKQWSNWNQALKLVAEPFRRGLEGMIRLHLRHLGSAFAYNSISKLHERVGQEIVNADEVDKHIRGWLASLDGVEAWDPEAERKAKRRKLKEDIEHGPLDYVPPTWSSQAKWVFVGSIGGGIGLASLWAQIDESGVVKDRIVRKDTEFRPENLLRWVPSPRNPKQMIPMEHNCQTKLQHQPQGALHVVWDRKCEVDTTAGSYRLYTNYCPFGDVHNLIEKNNSGLCKIPEAFMWMMFSVLTDCGLIMERGGVEAVHAGWKQIVHRDLKPMNIFLDLAAHDRWPRYPAPKMGDFGLGIETYPEDVGNPKSWRGLSGTQGYFAPEQLRLGEQSLREPLWQLLAHTNIWGTGRIMWDVVNHTPSFQRAMETAYLPDGTCILEIREAVRGLYSVRLLSMIGGCLHMDPKSRPTFAELRKRIDSAMSAPSAGRRDRGAGLQSYIHDARNGSQLANEAHDLHGLPDERYKLNMAFQNLNAGRGGGGASAGPGASGK